MIAVGIASATFFVSKRISCGADHAFSSSLGPSPESP
jgi:hypothetical protein